MDFGRYRGRCRYIRGLLSARRSQDQVDPTKTTPKQLDPADDGLRTPRCTAFLWHRKTASSSP